MIASLLLLMESLFPGRLAPVARGLHEAALVAAALWALRPPACVLMRKWTGRGRVRRVPFWICRCGNANPPEAPICGKCAASLPLSFGERWRVSGTGRFLVGAAGKAGALWRAAGWGAYYAVPLGVFMLLGVHRSGGGALREAFASLAFLTALAAIVLAGQALGRGAGGLAARAAQSLAVGALAGFVLLFSVLWAAAPFPPSQPLGRVHFFSDGRVHMETGGGAVVEARGRLQGETAEVRIRSAFLSWPLFQVRQSVPLALGETPLAEPWVVDALEKGARRFTTDAPHLLRVALREDTLFGRPGVPFVLRESADGAGLVLESPPQQS